MFFQNSEHKNVFYEIVIEHNTHNSCSDLLSMAAEKHSLW